MAYNPLEVANYFLELGRVDGIPIDPLKLQKLLYLAHGWHLATQGEPLLNEAIEAWPYGPVVPSVYHAFKHFGMKPITTRAGRFNGIDFTLAEFPDGCEHQDARAVMKQVWETHKGMSGLALSALSHAPGSPWDTVAAEHGGTPRNARISDDLIDRYFLQQARLNAAAPSKAAPPPEPIFD